MPASAQFARPTGILHYRTLSTWSTPYSLRRTAHSESRPFGQAVPHRDAAHATLQPRPLHTQRCNRDGCNRVQPIRANATHCHNVQLRSTARLRRTGSRGDKHCINSSVCKANAPEDTRAAALCRPRRDAYDRLPARPPGAGWQRRVGDARGQRPADGRAGPASE